MTDKRIDYIASLRDIDNELANPTKDGKPSAYLLWLRAKIVDHLGEDLAEELSLENEPGEE